MLRRAGEEFLEEYHDVFNDLEITKFEIAEKITIEFNIDNDKFLRAMLVVCPELTYCSGEWVFSFIGINDFVVKGPKQAQPVAFKLDIHQSRAQLHFFNKWRTLGGVLNTNTYGNMITFSNP